MFKVFDGLSLSIGRPLSFCMTMITHMKDMVLNAQAASGAGAVNVRCIQAKEHMRGQMVMNVQMQESGMCAANITLTENAYRRFSSRMLP